MPETIGKRYVIGEALGSGGMGAVFRARDRLALTDVALKRVHIPSEATETLSESGAREFELALAREFRTLSTLRHPNIIHVLDYGFDDQRRPYYTMELLADSTDLLEAASLASLDTKLEFLIQLLEALAYLHRREVLHRDLKPANLLVNNGSLKTLDFGLSSVLSGDPQGSAPVTGGTLLYLAPEMLQGAPASVASDLYAVGVLAYELFAGIHPFINGDPAKFMSEVVSTEPDLSKVEAPEQVVAFVARLLRKAPSDRFADALTALQALMSAAELPPREEGAELRESYLRAAAFVGREPELERLTAALDVARQGQGKILLLGGESGVGKSRLLQEFRSLALVAGTVVVEGQSVDTSGSAFHLWRNVLRQLVMIADPTPEQIGILKPLVPDVAKVSGVPATDPPPLEARGSRQRLMECAVQVILQHEVEVVVILEDLHWIGDDSLRVLQRLADSVASSPVLIIGTYRDDEFPALPGQVQDSEVIRLDRLDAESIADLCRSMLGEAGTSESMLEFLDKETEGNPFFLVEVVRTLAVEAGRLSEIDHSSLPETLFPTGVQAVVSRRLSRLPEDAITPLRFSAVAGRRVNFEILSELSRDMDQAGWLLSCSEAAVLEPHGDDWQFAHDKIRDGVIGTIPQEEAPVIFRQVAETIELLHPDEPEEAGRLADLWSGAGVSDKQLHYLLAAGDHARFQFAFSEANRRYERAQEMLINRGETARAARVWMQMGQSYEDAFQFERAHEAFKQGFLLWQQPTDWEKTVLPKAPHAFRMDWAEPQSLDPVEGNEIATLLFMGQMYEGMARITKTLDLVPLCAQSWEPLDEGRRYRFHLKPDLKWSDGHPLSAYDFECAFKRLLDLRPQSSLTASWMNVKGAEEYLASEIRDLKEIGFRALDRRTVEVELNEPSAGSLADIATVLPVPKHLVDQDPENWARSERCACNGPFMPVRWEHGRLLELVRNPHYSGVYSGNVERVELHLANLEVRRRQIEGYESDEVDFLFLTTLDVELQALVRERYADEIIVSQGDATLAVIFDCSRPPFDDPRLRKAFSSSIDKFHLIEETATRGFPATGGYIHPWMPGHSPEIGIKLDFQEAKHIVEESGLLDQFGDGDITLLSMELGQPVCEYLQAAWKKHLRIEVKIDLLEWYEYLESVRNDPAHLNIIAVGTTSPLDLLSGFLSDEGGFGSRGWKSEAFELAFNSARRAGDPGVRLKKLREADQILMEEAPILPLVYWPLEYLVKPWVRALPLNSDGLWDFKDAIIDPHE
jgi:ABC-type oligopeptide transport system substrate-binding subunit